MIVFVAGFLTALALLWIIGAVAVFLMFRTASREPLTREQVEALRDRARGTLMIVKAHDELPSRMESRN